MFALKKPALTVTVLFPVLLVHQIRRKDMNTYKALKEILPWAKPMYVEKAKIKHNKNIKVLSDFFDNVNIFIPLI